MCETRPASWGSNNPDVDNQLGATALTGSNLKSFINWKLFIIANCSFTDFEEFERQFDDSDEEYEILW